MQHEIEINEDGTFDIVDIKMSYVHSTSATYGEGQEFGIHKFNLTDKYGEREFIVIRAGFTMTLKELVDYIRDTAAVTLMHDNFLYLKWAGTLVMEEVVGRDLFNDQWADAYVEAPLCNYVFQVAHNRVYVTSLYDFHPAYEWLHNQGDINLNFHYVDNDKF